MKDNISPEEKLLKLIRGQKKPPSAATISAPKTKFNPSARLFSLANKHLFHLELRKAIFAFFVFACSFLVISLVWPWLSLRNIRLTDIPQQKSQGLVREPRPHQESFEFYKEAIQGKQIFSANFSGETAKPLSGVNFDLTKDINLVGIISGENPQAIVEDKKNHKTSYVSKGQFIGENQVEDILEGKIIINRIGQRFELYL